MYVMPDTTVVPYKGITPKIADDVFLASGTRLSGDIEIGEKSNLWFNVAARGDVNYIRIGKATNIQDNSVIHVTYKGNPTIIGDNVTVGHSATLHACTIKDNALIGMGAVVLDGAVIEEYCLVAAGAVVSPGKTFEPGSLIIGSPARVKRPLSERERQIIDSSALRYLDVAKDYLDSASHIQSSL